MGFLTIFYKDMIQQYFIVQIFLPHPRTPLTAPPELLCFIRHPVSPKYYADDSHNFFLLSIEMLLDEQYCTTTFFIV